MKTQPTLFDILNRNRDFKKNRHWSPKIMRAAHDACSIDVDWKRIHACSEKVSRGVYQLDLEKYEKYTDLVVEKKPAQKKSRVTKTPAEEVAFAKPESVAEQKEEAFSFGKKVARQYSYPTIPDIDPNYEPFGHYRDIDRIITSRKFFPFFITGHSGNGKSSQPLQICARRKIPVIRMNMTRMTDEEKLIGHQTLVDGNVVVVEGPVLTAMRTGSILLLEEFDAADANNIMCLQGIMEGRPYFFQLSGEYVRPAEGFNIIATANTKGRGSDDGRYAGTQIMNDAFLERFVVTFEQEFPPVSVEKKIVMNWMNSRGCVDEQFADELVKWADAIRRTFREGAISDLIATRRLEHIVNVFSIFRNKEKAIEMCTSRFDLAVTQSFRDLFKQIAKPTVVPPEAGLPSSTEQETVS